MTPWSGRRREKEKAEKCEFRLVPTVLGPHHKQKQQAANDPSVSRVPTGSVSPGGCEKQQLLICFHAFTESNWGSDGALALQTEWGEASGHELNEDIKPTWWGNYKREEGVQCSMHKFKPLQSYLLLLLNYIIPYEVGSLQQRLLEYFVTGCC